jgi:hypothetical protein
MRQVIYYVASGPRPGLVWRFRCRVGTDFAPAARRSTCGASAPCGSGSGRLVDGAGTPARIGRTLTIAGRDYGKGEGRRPLRPSGRGHSGFRSVLGGRKGGRGPPLWIPRPLRAFPPPSLVSILVFRCSLVGVSSERSLSPARNGTQAAASAVLGGRGRTRSKMARAPTAGVGRGRSRHPPRPDRNRGRPTWPA